MPVLLCDLPFELIDHILEYVNNDGLAQLAKTSRTLYWRSVPILYQNLDLIYMTVKEDPTPLSLRVRWALSDSDRYGPVALEQNEGLDQSRLHNVLTALAQ